MRTYTPTYTGKDAEIRREFEAIKKATTRADPFMELEVMYAAPAKLRTGMVVYADGTTWNPGSGEGIYRRNLAGAWVFLG